jgi:hypothetical protein
VTRVTIQDGIVAVRVKAMRVGAQHGGIHGGMEQSVENRKGVKVP